MFFFCNLLCFFLEVLNKYKFHNKYNFCCNCKWGMGSKNQKKSLKKKQKIRKQFQKMKGKHFNRSKTNFPMLLVEFLVFSFDFFNFLLFSFQFSAKTFFLRRVSHTQNILVFPWRMIRTFGTGLRSKNGVFWAFGSGPRAKIVGKSQGKCNNSALGKMANFGPFSGPRIHIVPKTQCFSCFCVFSHFTTPHNTQHTTRGPIQ